MRSWDFVNVGRDGTFSGDGRIKSSPSDVDKLIEQLAADKPERLLLVFHGGLVDEARAIEGIARIHHLVQRDGVRPIFFVWETGLGDIVKDVIEESTGGWFSKLLESVARIVAPRVVRNPSRSALTTGEVVAKLTKLRPFEGIGDASRSAVDVTPDLEATLEIEAREIVNEAADTSPEVLVTVPEDVERLLRERYVDEADARSGGWWWLIKAVASVSYRCISRHARNRDHGAYCTIVEEILREVGVAAVGRRIWSEMKERAFEMWLPNEGRAGMALHAGRYFVEKLAEARQRNPGWEFSVNLVGHSAGSIAVCHLLEALGTGGLDVPTRKVVLHAPACTTRMFVEQVVRRMEHPAKPIESVRVFTMNDRAECDDTVGGIFYPRSLLYFISGVLEKEADAPILGLERHIYGVVPVNEPELAAFFADAHRENRLVLSPTRAEARVGYASGAKTHEGFAFDEATLASLVHYVSQTTG